MAEKKTSSSPSPSEVNTWSTQIIPKGNTTVSAGTSVATIGGSEYAKKLYNMTTAERKTIAQALKNAGYKVNTNGVFSRALVDSYGQAIQNAQLSAQELEQSFNDTFFANYLAQETLARGGTGAGGPSKTISTVEDVSLRAMAIAVLEAQTGDQGTEAEINDLIRRAKKKQEKNPKVTTYTTSGGVTKSDTTGGVDVGQFMIDIVSKTDEARANKVLRAYNIAVNTFGGLR